MTYSTYHFAQCPRCKKTRQPEAGEPGKRNASDWLSIHLMFVHDVPFAEAFNIPTVTA